MTVLSKKSDPFQQSTCQQLPVDRGAGGRGEALRFAPTPKGSQGVTGLVSDFADFEGLGEPGPGRRPLQRGVHLFVFFRT